jgi:cell division protein ZapA
MASIPVQIRIELGGREFDLKVPAEEVGRVQEAAAIVRQRLTGYSKRFQLKDDYYMSLMCCLELATEQLDLQQRLEQVGDEIAPELAQLDKLMSETLAAIDTTNPTQLESSETTPESDADAGETSENEEEAYEDYQ